MYSGSKQLWEPGSLCLESVQVRCGMSYDQKANPPVTNPQTGIKHHRDPTSNLMHHLYHALPGLVW